MIPFSDQAAVAAILDLLGLPVSLLSPLTAHADAVARSSSRLGLVSDGDEGQVLARHTADSLVVALARQPQARERWVDVGSGAGFPGVVLAICYPQTSFTLVESNAKKAGFLELVSLDLGISNLDVVRSRAERLDPGFDVAVERAAAEPTRAAQLLKRLVRPGGVVLLAATGEPPKEAEKITFELPFVDSPASIFMIAAADGEKP